MFFCLVFVKPLCTSVFVPCGHLLTSWLSLVVFDCKFVTIPLVLGQVWCLIVSIPDLCTHTYLDQF